MDNLDILLNAVLVGVVVGAFFMTVGALLRVGWKFWYVVAIATLAYYFISQENMGLDMYAIMIRMGDGDWIYVTEQTYNCWDLMPELYETFEDLKDKNANKELDFFKKQMKDTKKEMWGNQ